MTLYGPSGNTPTVCAPSILAAKHKGLIGSSTQDTPHVFIEEQKKPRHTCYSAPNVYASLQTSLYIPENPQLTMSPDSDSAEYKYIVLQIKR